MLEKLFRTEATDQLKFNNDTFYHEGKTDIETVVLGLAASYGLEDVNGLERAAARAVDDYTQGYHPEGRDKVRARARHVFNDLLGRAIRKTTKFYRENPDKT